MDRLYRPRVACESAWVQLEVEPVVVLHGTRCIRARRYDDGSMPSTVLMFSRPGCGLCDDAREGILAARAIRLRQVPLAVVMVGLTTLTLWSLGQALFIATS